MFMLVMLRVLMGLCRQTKLETKVGICRAIAYVEIECGLTRSTCPDHSEHKSTDFQRPVKPLIVSLKHPASSSNCHCDC